MIKNEKRKDPEGSRLDRPVKGGLQPTKGAARTALTVVLPREHVALRRNCGDANQRDGADRMILDPVARATDPGLLLLRHGHLSDGILVLDSLRESEQSCAVLGGHVGGNVVQFHGFVPLGCAQSAKALRAGFVDSDTKIMYK